MDKVMKYVEKLLPKYAVISLVFCFAWNCFVYWSTQFLCAGREHFDLTTDFDRWVPVQSWWVLIYVASFLFWVVCYIFTARLNEKEFWFRFVTADLLSRTVCGVIFIILPTTNVRPELAMDSVWDVMLSIIYRLDMPYDLFPSIHCIISLLCYLGLHKSDKISAKTKTGVLIFALLIFASTQFTKQHYIVDVISGVILTLLCYNIAMRTDLYKPVMAVFERINEKLFRGMNEKQEKNSL